MKISRKYAKIFSALIILMCLLSSVGTVYAGSGQSMLSNMESQTKNFLDRGSQQVEGNIDYGNVVDDFVSLGQILTFLGGGIVVAVLIYMGIKYLTAGPEAQAKLKTQLIGVVVSAMVIFGAYFIWKTIVKVASTF